MSSRSPRWSERERADERTVADLLGTEAIVFFFSVRSSLPSLHELSLTYAVCVALGRVRLNLAFLGVVPRLTLCRSQVLLGLPVPPSRYVTFSLCFLWLTLMQIVCRGRPAHLRQHRASGFRFISVISMHADIPSSLTVRLQHRRSRSHLLLGRVSRMRRILPSQLRADFPFPSVASIIGFGTNFYQERLYRKHFARRGPEARLYASLIGGLVFPAGAFALAFSQGRGHWMGPVVGLVLIFSGVYSIYLAVFSYLADCYTIVRCASLSPRVSCTSSPSSASLTLLSCRSTHQALCPDSRSAGI